MSVRWSEKSHRRADFALPIAGSVFLIDHSVNSGILSATRGEMRYAASGNDGKRRDYSAIRTGQSLVDRREIRSYHAIRTEQMF